MSRGYPLPRASPSPQPSISAEEAWGLQQRGRQAATSTQSRNGPAEDTGSRHHDLLLETRKLLNVLNNENTDLKTANDDLKTQLAKKQNEKERVESDMKKINLNLMEDLRKKSAAVKDLERQLSLVSADVSKEARRSTDSFSRVATLEAENTLLKEQVRAANARSESLTKELHLLEDALEKGRDDVSRVSKAGLQAVEDARRELMDRIRELEREVLEARMQLNSKTQQVEEMGTELRKAAAFLEDREQVSHQYNNVAADMQFARQQLYDQAVGGVDTLSGISNYVRSLEVECERNESALGDATRQIKSLQDALQQLTSLDLTAFNGYEESLRSGRAQLARELENVAYLQGEINTHRATSNDLSAKLNEYKSEVTQLTQIFSDLQDAVEEGEANLKRGHGQLKAKEDENQELQGKLKLEQEACALLRSEVAALKQRLLKTEDSRDQLEVQLGNERSVSVSQSSLHEQRIHDVQRELRRTSDVLMEERARYEAEISELRSEHDSLRHTLSSALGQLSLPTSHRTSAAPSRTPASSVPRDHKQLTHRHQHRSVDPYETQLQSGSRQTSLPATPQGGAFFEGPPATYTDRGPNPLMAAIQQASNSQSASRRSSWGGADNGEINRRSEVFGYQEHYDPQHLATSYEVNTLVNPRVKPNHPSHPRFNDDRPFSDHAPSSRLSSPVGAQENCYYSPASNVSGTPRRDRSVSGANTNLVGS